MTNPDASPQYYPSAATLNKEMPQVFRYLLIAMISLPAIYFFFAIQYSAILYPYWDHMATIPIITRFYDGQLTYADLISPMNEARPLIPRLVFLLNAIATDWDIRSEYAILWVCTSSIFLIHIAALRSNLSKKKTLYLYVGILLFSIFAFSPAGAHTQYYSLMLIPVISILFATLAVTILCRNPDSWWLNAVAAALAWLSAYSVSNGLFLFVSIFVVQQLSGPKIGRLNAKSVFWLINTIVICIVYLPGISRTGTPSGIVDWITFVLVYIGNPLSSLIWFPVSAQFVPSETTRIPAFYGAIILIITAWTALKALPALRSRQPEAFLFFTFSILAVISAVVTGFGRAVGEYTVPLASGSRYTIFSVILIFALLHYHIVQFSNQFDSRRFETAVSDEPARGRARILGGIVLICFIFLSGISYTRAIPVYTHAHDMNVDLSNAYGRSGAPSELDTAIAPVKLLDLFHKEKRDLHRLNIGPYRMAPKLSVALSSGPMADNLQIVAGERISQRFKPAGSMLKSVSIQFVDYGRPPSHYYINWKIFSVSSGGRQQIGWGRLASETIQDWQTIEFRLFEPAIMVGYVDIEFSVASGQDMGAPVGIPLFRPLPPQDAFPAKADSIPRESGAVFGMTAHYER